MNKDKLMIYDQERPQNRNSEVRILNAFSRHELRVQTPIQGVCTKYWSYAPEFIAYGTDFVLRGDKESFYESNLPDSPCGDILIT